MAQTTKHLFELEKLNHIFELADGKAEMMMEACVWCMDFCNHANGVLLRVAFNKQLNTYSILWPEGKIDFDKIRISYNFDDAIEYGSEAIALLIVSDLTDYETLQRSMTKTGIDYWLGYKSSNPDLPFNNAGRLEISGIMKESEDNTIDKRIKIKLRQSKQSDNFKLPVHVVVVAFGQPYAKMVINNVNN